MKKQFYSHIITVDALYVALDELQVTQKEKEHLKTIIDTSLYHTILDAVLSELPEEEKGMFLERIAEDNHEKTLDFLQKRIFNIEDKIKKTASDLIKELHADVIETKSK